MQIAPRAGMPMSANLRFGEPCLAEQMHGYAALLHARSSGVSTRGATRNRRFTNRSFGDKCVPNRRLGTSPHGLSPSTHYEKLDYGRRVDPKGSAGILPASAGILPASWCRRAGDGVGLHSARAQASGRMPKAAGWKPALPFGYTRMGIFGVVPMGCRPPRIMKMGRGFGWRR